MSAPKDLEKLRAEIVRRHEELSPRLQQVAQFVLDHPQDMGLQTLAVIAQRCHVQPSTVVRFAKAMGYRGASDMQRLFRDEILALQAAGILVEVSAGNEGPSCQTLRSPGDYTEVLTTGSVNHANPFPGTITGFSSRGPSDLDGNYFPDITAPGESIRSSLPGTGYASWSGTSMAGPHVAGATALLREALGDMRPRS